MAIFFDAPVGPDDVTQFTRQVPVNPSLRLFQMFPTRVHDNNKVNFLEVVHTNRVAKYRAYDAAFHVSDRDTGSEKSVPLPALSSSSPVIGEYERLQLEFARTAGTNVQALRNAIYNDAENLTGEIYNRWELSWGDVLTDGKLTTTAAAENGFAFEADYGVPGGHIVSAGTAWTTIATADALGDLISWTDTYIATNGVAPASFLTSTRVMRLLQTNAKIIAAVTGTAAGRSRVTAAEVRELLSSEGLPTPMLPYDAQLSVDDVTTKVIADDRIIFLPANLGDLGHNAVGVSATALELVNSADSDLTFSDAAGIVGLVVKNNEPPFRQKTFVDAVGMPVLDNPKLLMVADVA